MALAKTGIYDFGWKARDFKLKGVDGKSYKFADVRGPNGTLVAFICNHCPYVKASIDRIVAEAQALREIGIGTIAIMPNNTAIYHEDSFDNMKAFAGNPPELVSPTAVLVREAEAKSQLSEEGAPGPAPGPESPPAPEPQPGTPGPVTGPTSPSKPRRFYGSVEIDMVRPVKSFDAILNAVVMELQRTQGAKVKLTLEIQAEADEGFADIEVSVVRDNARQLKFKAESTGFEE